MLDQAKLKALGEESKTANPTRLHEIQREIMLLLADDLMPEARQLVKMVEAKPATTQNHYGDYMAILGDCPNKIALASMAMALRRAGANPDGLAYAVKFTL